MSQELSPIPAANAPVAQGQGWNFSTAWYQYLWRQWLGLYPVRCAPVNAPAAPASGFVIYCDVADGVLKAKASSGAVTILANP